jgi:hypothetical protein
MRKRKGEREKGRKKGNYKKMKTGKGKKEDGREGRERKQGGEN